MTQKLDLDKILLKVAEARADSDLRFTAPWVFEVVPALVERVGMLEELLGEFPGKADRDALAHAGQQNLEAVRRMEREACAQLADADPRDGKAWAFGEQQEISDIIAAAIRARKP